MMVQYITKLIQLNFPTVQHMFQQLHSPQAGWLQNFSADQWLLTSAGGGC